MNERLAVGDSTGPDVFDLIELARTTPCFDGRPAIEDGGFRERLADWYVAAQGLKLTRKRAMTSLSRGQTPGPEASIGKLISARQMQDLATEALDRLDQYGVIAERSVDGLAGAFQLNFFLGGAMRIAGGTDEILRNIIAERVLGLPSDIRVDRHVAFKDVPTGA
jgi:alkylation response protein AidB-like acyl-CoA dehydrogenase